MFRKTQITLVISLACFLMVACTRETALESEEKPQVVLECVLSDDNIQTLSLMLTGTESEGSAAIEDAGIELFDKTSSESAGVFSYVGSGQWQVGYSATPGHRYRVEAKVPGYDLIYAEQTMPERAKVFSGVQFDDDGYWIRIGMKSLPPRTWAYAMNYDSDKKTHETADYICTDYPKVDNFNLSGDVYKPDTVYVNPILGYCVSYPMLAGKPLHKKFLKLTGIQGDEAEEGQAVYFYISGSFSGNFFHRYGEDQRPASDESYLVISSVSEDYNRYLEEAVYHQQLQESSDFTTIYIRDNIFSNIHGGLGILGAQTRQILQWDYSYKKINKL